MNCNIEVIITLNSKNLRVAFTYYAVTYMVISYMSKILLHIYNKKYYSLYK